MTAEERAAIVADIEAHKALRQQAINNANAASGVVQYLESRLAALDAADAAKAKGKK